MIIVKNKGKQNPIFIPRNTITDPVSNNNGGEISSITEEYVDGRIEEVKEYVDEQVNTKQDTLVSGENIKTINGNPIIGDGDITIEGGSTNIIELTQDEYDNLEEKDENTIYVITDAPAIDIPDTSNFATKTDLNSKQDTLVSSQNIKTINGESILGSGNITIEGGSGGGEIPEGVKPTYYLWKEMSSNGNSSMLNNNKNVRNILLTYGYSEEYPIVILKDYYNNTISNNLYIRGNYIEIQCCNSRVGGESSDLIDERYELTADGWLKEVKKEIVASQKWVNDKLGDIESILNNIIGQE